MDLKRFLIPYCPGVRLPSPASIASTPVELLAPMDVEVEWYAAMFLDAQGKLPSIEEVLAELENDAD